MLSCLIMDMDGTNVSHKTGAVKHGKILQSTWKFSWNSFSFVDWQVISSLLLGYQMLRSFPFCLAKTEKKATSLQITLKQFIPFYKGL